MEHYADAMKLLTWLAVNALALGAAVMFQSLVVETVRRRGYSVVEVTTGNAAVKTLQARDFFKHYTEKTRQVADGGEVAVTPANSADST